uniref:La ribonucleoprotein 6, translational regulator n=1 Tax=Rhinopithecus bieti TaxID=61621 RepID=A0A2K6L2N0_RHIBE
MAPVLAGRLRPGPETAVQIPRSPIQEAEDVEQLEDEEEGGPETRGAGTRARASEEEPSRGHRDRSSVNSRTMLTSFIVSSAPSTAPST